MKILVFALFFSLTSFAKDDCSMLEYDSSNQNTDKIASLVCGVLNDSFPELFEVGIKIDVIEDNLVLNKFSGGKLSFISFFTGNRLNPFSKKDYIIGYSRNKLFSGDTPSDEALKGVIAHELTHTVLWKNLTPAGSVAYAAYTTLGNEKVRSKYERAIDIKTIERGIKYGNLYAESLSKYREWNLQKTEPEKRSYLKSVYYFASQLTLMEELGSLLKGEEREKFFKLLRKEAPVENEKIRDIYQEAISRY